MKINQLIPLDLRIEHLGDLKALNDALKSN